ncbi:hypothetical protein SLH49_12975 [Cognatiyoonia sp. IB215446]|uniref:hypothetical protein n=1 Tax=Cognatiyoonia sp. IB215446 TaxID=3097355 RepID=UPI002A173C5C|nr:hypothetical protein [Cognatiyoonia sp. IB215446]MDX8348892.1 hypothetical protein [Cognatiyoonia sp. IB215446]
MKDTSTDGAMAQFAKRLAINCVRNTVLEDYHSGRVPKTKSGDFSDVRVIDAEGTEVPWIDVSRISDEEMKRLMKCVVDRLYTCLMRTEEPGFIKLLAAYDASTDKWDAPQIDQGFIEHLNNLAGKDTS